MQIAFLIVVKTLLWGIAAYNAARGLLLLWLIAHAVASGDDPTKGQTIAIACYAAIVAMSVYIAVHL